MKVTLIKPENSIDYVYLCLFYHLISYGKTFKWFVCVVSHRMLKRHTKKRKINDLGCTNESINDKSCGRKLLISHFFQQQLSWLSDHMRQWTSLNISHNVLTFTE